MISVVIQGESGLRLVGGGRLRLGLGLRGGDGLLDGDGVDLRHERRQRGVDHPVALQQPLPLELVRHHLDLVARAAPAGCIGDHEVGRAERGGDGGLHVLLGDAHGSSVRDCLLPSSWPSHAPASASLPPLLLVLLRSSPPPRHSSRSQPAPLGNRARDPRSDPSSPPRRSLDVLV